MTATPKCYVCSERDGPYSLGGRPVCRNCYEELYYRNFSEADSSLLSSSKKDVPL